jgi:hypothetical protein
MEKGGKKAGLQKFRKVSAFFLKFLLNEKQRFVDTN